MRAEDTMRRLSWLTLGSAALLVVACGGDGAEAVPDAAPGVPDAAPSTPDAADTPDAAPAAFIDFSADDPFPGDWAAIPSAEVIAFYPAQASWQWLNGPGHTGAAGVSGGVGCVSCHSNGASAGDAKALGTRLVNHATLEPSPISGKVPWLAVNVQAAYDQERFYMRLRWQSEEPGIRHYLTRFDGQEWKQYGGPKPDVLEKGERPSYEDRVTMLLDDLNVPAKDGTASGFRQFGCFQTCHTAMRAMPLEPEAATVQAAIGREDVRKYLLISRNPAKQNDADGAWADMKPAGEIGQLLAEGKFLDLWQWRAARSAPVRYAGDDYVLEYRNFDQTGQNPFANNFNAESPVRFMYDANVVGFNAIPLAELDDRMPAFPLIVGQTAVAFDPGVTFQTDDIVSRLLLQVPTESRADVRAFSTWDAGQWTVVLVRNLDTGRPDDKRLVDGQVYTIGLSVFDDHVSNRRHHVTFPLRLGLGVATDTDVNAVRLP
jgi:hypothetical protein